MFNKEEKILLISGIGNNNYFYMFQSNLSYLMLQIIQEMLKFHLVKQISIMVTYVFKAA